MADKVGRRWLLVFAGYVFNVLAVPALALAGQWQIAGSLIVVQGIGRGLRKPIIQAMLSHATGSTPADRCMACTPHWIMPGGPLVLSSSRWCW